MNVKALAIFIGTQRVGVLFQYVLALPQSAQTHASGEVQSTQHLSPALVRADYAMWPRMIEAADITNQQKKRLLEHFYAHPMVASLAKRVQ